MPRVDFHRVDLNLTVRLSADGEATIRLGPIGKQRTLRFSPRQVAKWREELPRLPLQSAVKSWRAMLSRPIPATRVLLLRIAIDVCDSELAALPWETCFPLAALKGGAKPVIVRLSPVRPRVELIPLTLPVRILQVDPATSRPLPEFIGAVFKGTPKAQVLRAMQWRTCSLEQVPSAPGATRLGWPTLEVLHFDRFPDLHEITKIQDRSRAEVRGTLGWLDRLVDVWQTRLVVLHCETGAELGGARKIASMLANRSGPAVLVAQFPSASTAGTFYRQFYGNLVHDFPLDANLSALIPSAFATGYSQISLFAGAGREETLRVSSLAVDLLELHNELGQAKETVRVSQMRTLVARAEGQSVETRPMIRALAAMQTPLRKMQAEWQTMRFEFHESEGVLPLSQTLHAVRKTLGLPSRPVPPSKISKPSPRYVNSSLWSEAGDGKMIALSQERASLCVGDTYHLGIQVGAKDSEVFTVGASALIEEIFKWTPDAPGIWLEIGVVGLDFEVLGELVQEFWLPRTQPSELIRFAVIPRVESVARLRFCLYHRQNLIQSFRLAAITRREKGPIPGSRERRRRLARALGLRIQDVPNVGFLPRLEYALSPMLDEPRPARAISLLANDLDGRSIVTVKGADIFGTVATDNTLPLYVQNIRGALDAIATPPLPGLEREYWPYGFGLPTQPNGGTESKLKAALQQLARCGRQLFDAIIPANQRAKLEQALAQEQQVIHVAHVLLEKVIPWSVLYDAPYDADKRLEAGQPVAHDVCLAALPRPDGTLPCDRCGFDPRCLLHPDQIKARQAAGRPALLRKTVVCPLHFWGFKHIVEVPPQQVPSDQSETPSLPERILCQGPAQLLAGLHAGLKLTKQHVSTLDRLATSTGVSATWKGKTYQRDDLLSRLEDTDLDLIYLYCHARGGIADPLTKPPFLELEENGRITADQFDAEQLWKHRPLVFLNGCGTVGFSPDALSPFITKLVRDRGAAAIIGTEVPVWEQLAGEMAECFLRDFLARIPVGKALLNARRSLLKQKNPLGLVYTLYGASQLVLADA